MIWSKAAVATLVIAAPLAGVSPTGFDEHAAISLGEAVSIAIGLAWAFILLA